MIEYMKEHNNMIGLSHALLDIHRYIPVESVQVLNLQTTLESVSHEG